MATGIFEGITRIDDQQIGRLIVQQRGKLDKEKEVDQRDDESNLTVCEEIR